MAIDTVKLIQSDLASLADALHAPDRPAIAPASGPGENAAGFSFAQTLQHALSEVNAADQDANKRMAAVDSGQSDDLVGAMLASQQASLSFSMLVQVRNKVMGAVDDLIKLPL
jgi:flagellar hook-basal body complex protein FliE